MNLIHETACPITLKLTLSSRIRKLSYSGHSFTPRGATPKKDKKRKQEFHKHKLKITDEGPLDVSKLKERAALALAKLGSQKFSADPGGYTFSNWMTSFNMLLDDFEEKVGAASLPRDYYDYRQKLTDDLLRPVDTSDIDDEIEKMDAEIKSTELEIAKLTAELSSIREKERETSAKIAILKRARADADKELVSANNDLNSAKKKQTLFNRLFSGRRIEVDSAKSRVDSIEEEQKSIERQILELENTSETSDDDRNNHLSLLNLKLTDLRYNLGELSEKKEQEMQLSEKRIKATSEMSKKIDSLDISAGNNSKEEPQ